MVVRALGVLLLTVAAVVAGDVPVGTVVDAEHAALVDGLVPPEVAAHYKAGDYQNRVEAWPKVAAFEPAFVEASEKNAAALDVDANGTIVGKDGKPAQGLQESGLGHLHLDQILCLPGGPSWIIAVNASTMISEVNHLHKIRV